MNAQAHPLAACELVTLTDPQAVHSHLSRFFCPHKMAPVGLEGKFDFRHCVAELGENSLSYLRYGREVDIHPKSLEHFYLITIPLRGKIDIRYDKSDIKQKASQPIIVNPDDRCHMRWSKDCEAVTLKIAAKHLHSLAASRNIEIKTDQLFFSSSSRIGDSASHRLRRLLMFMVSEIDFYEDVEGEIAQETLDCMISAVANHLFTFHLPSSCGCSNAPDQRVTSPVVKRAERLVRSALTPIESVEVLADLVGASVRTLQLHFRRDRNMTPQEFLLAARLENIRASLVEGGPGMSVTTAAHEAGWSQLGRLSRAYRRRFGELPSETLKHSRGQLIANAKKDSIKC